MAADILTTGPENTWVEKFLKDRKQRVACEGMFSDLAPVISWVPQGSVIAILFLIYIRVIPPIRYAIVSCSFGLNVLYEFAYYRTNRSICLFMYK